MELSWSEDQFKAIGPWTCKTIDEVFTCHQEISIGSL